MKKYSTKKRIKNALIAGVATVSLLSALTAGGLNLKARQYIKQNPQLDLDTVQSQIDYWGGDQRYVDTSYNTVLFKESSLANHFGVPKDGVINIGYDSDVPDAVKDQVNYVFEYLNQIFKIINPNYKFEENGANSAKNCDIYVKMNNFNENASAHVHQNFDTINPSKMTSATICINKNLDTSNIPHVRFSVLHEMLHILYGSGDVNYNESETFSIYNYDDTAYIIDYFNKISKNKQEIESFVTLTPTDVATLIAIYGDENNNHNQLVDLINYTLETCVNKFGSRPGGLGFKRYLPYDFVSPTDENGKPLINEPAKSTLPTFPPISRYR